MVLVKRNCLDSEDPTQTVVDASPDSHSQAAQQRGGSIVEIPQGALAAVMSLNEFPQDIPRGDPLVGRVT